MIPSSTPRLARTPPRRCSPDHDATRKSSGMNSLTRRLHYGTTPVGDQDHPERRSPGSLPGSFAPQRRTGTAADGTRARRCSSLERSKPAEEVYQRIPPGFLPLREPRAWPKRNQPPRNFFSRREADRKRSRILPGSSAPQRRTGTAADGTRARRCSSLERSKPAEEVYQRILSGFICPSDNLQANERG